MFLSSESLIKIAQQKDIFSDFTEDRVKHGAYELTIGDHYYVTSSDRETTRPLVENEQFKIPPGQMAILITEEVISMPLDHIGFISIKYRVKIAGMINISGFHVDPGFRGQLKFSVYNAGPEPIVLQRGQKVFSIWFAQLDQRTNPYNGDHQDQTLITPTEVMQLQGEIASPGVILDKFNSLEKDYSERINKIEIHHAGLQENLKWAFRALIGAIISVIIGIALWWLKESLTTEANTKTNAAESNNPRLEQTKDGNFDSIGATKPNENNSAPQLIPRDPISK